MPNRLLQFFGYGHLPDQLKEVSKPFGEMAKRLDEMLPDNPEKTWALRDLLTAKDNAVRSMLAGNENPL